MATDPKPAPIRGGLLLSALVAGSACGAGAWLLLQALGCAGLPAALVGPAVAGYALGGAGPDRKTRLISLAGFVFGAAIGATMLLLRELRGDGPASGVLSRVVLGWLVALGLGLAVLVTLHLGAARSRGR